MHSHMHAGPFAANVFATYESRACLDEAHRLYEAMDLPVLERRLFDALRGLAWALRDQRVARSALRNAWAEHYNAQGPR